MWDARISWLLRLAAWAILIGLLFGALVFGAWVGMSWSTDMSGANRGVMDYAYWARKGSVAGAATFRGPHGRSRFPHFVCAPAFCLNRAQRIDAGKAPEQKMPRQRKV